jgi:hypothetical protein
VFAVFRQCVNSLNLFCCVCGEFTPKWQRISITRVVKKAYDSYLAGNLGIRTRSGLHIHVAIDVRDIYVAGSLPLNNRYLSQSLWCGENRRILLRIATFV